MSGRRRWWRGAVEAVCVYVAYSGFELLRAKAAGTETAARHHAAQVIHAERSLGLFHEAWVQHGFLQWHRFVEFWDIYYGTVHFVGPAVGLFALWRWMPARYRLWRNTFFGMLLVGLVGFWLYPLAPPRLLPDHFGFVDTAARIGGMGPFDSGSMKDTENLWAAMPSLHVGWALWSTLALWPVVRGRAAWVRWALAAYPALTVFAVVVTANHYLLDAVGGAVALAAGYGLTLAVTPQTRNDRLEEAVVS